MCGGSQDNFFQHIPLSFREGHHVQERGLQLCFHPRGKRKLRAHQKLGHRYLVASKLQVRKIFQFSYMKFAVLGICCGSPQWICGSQELDGRDHYACNFLHTFFDIHSPCFPYDHEYMLMNNFKCLNIGTLDRDLTFFFLDLIFTKLMKLLRVPGNSK